jgi:hypothetical protein
MHTYKCRKAWWSIARISTPIEIESQQKEANSTGYTLIAALHLITVRLWYSSLR